MERLLADYFSLTRQQDPMYPRVVDPVVHCGAAYTGYGYRAMDRDEVSFFVAVYAVKTRNAYHIRLPQSVLLTIRSVSSEIVNYKRMGIRGQDL